MRVSLLSLVFMVGFLPSWAEASINARDAREYEQCLARIENDAELAYDRALAWRDAGGGAAAKHCVALALLAMGQEEEAAIKLELLALEPGSGFADDRATLLQQAGQAWIMAARPDEADVALSSAIELDSKNATIYLDRAQAHRMRGDTNGAEMDLSQAISLDRSYAEAYLLRGTLRRLAGDLSGAKTDIDRVLELDRQNIDALVERGRIAELMAGRDLPE